MLLACVYLDIYRIENSINLRMIKTRSKSETKLLKDKDKAKNKYVICVGSLNDQKLILPNLPIKGNEKSSSNTGNLLNPKKITRDKSSNLMTLNVNQTPQYSNSNLNITNSPSKLCNVKLPSFKETYKLSSNGSKLLSANYNKEFENKSSNLATSTNKVNKEIKKALTDHSNNKHSSSNLSSDYLKNPTSIPHVKNLKKDKLKEISQININKSQKNLDRLSNIKSGNE